MVWINAHAFVIASLNTKTRQPQKQMFIPRPTPWGRFKHKRTPLIAATLNRSPDKIDELYLAGASDTKNVALYVAIVNRFVPELKSHLRHLGEIDNRSMVIAFSFIFRKVYRESSTIALEMFELLFDAIARGLTVVAEVFERFLNDKHLERFIGMFALKLSQTNVNIETRYHGERVTGFRVVAEDDVLLVSVNPKYASSKSTLYTLAEHIEIDEPDSMTLRRWRRLEKSSIRRKIAARTLIPDEFESDQEPTPQQELITTQETTMKRVRFAQ